MAVTHACQATHDSLQGQYQHLQCRQRSSVSFISGRQAVPGVVLVNPYKCVCLWLWVVGRHHRASAAEASHRCKEVQVASGWALPSLWQPIGNGCCLSDMQTAAVGAAAGLFRATCVRGGAKLAHGVKKRQESLSFSSFSPFFTPLGSRQSA